MSYGGGRGRGTLGQAVYCEGQVAIGGAARWSIDGSALWITPDDEPGVEYLVHGTDPSVIPSMYRESAVASRLAVVGDLLTDRTLLTRGSFGRLGSNEFYARQNRGPCETTAYPPKPADGAAPPPPTPQPAFTGEREATVHVVGGGQPTNVIVYTSIGTFRLSTSSDPTNADELATIAPQGPSLTIVGKWDSESGTVSVTDWWITALGEGTKKYGVTPSGDIVPQSPDVPSTDWPGGLPKPPGGDVAEPVTSPSGALVVGAAPQGPAWGPLALLGLAALALGGGFRR